MAPLSFILSGDWTSPELVPGGRALLAFDCALVQMMTQRAGKPLMEKRGLSPSFGSTFKSTSIEVSRETVLRQEVAGSFATEKP